MRKPRKDAVLQNLPEDRQDQIVKWLGCAEVKDADGNVTQPGGIELAMSQLAADGLRVSESQLSRFWRWYQLDRRYSGMRQTADQLKEMAVAKGVPLEKAQELAQGMFTLQAIQANDAETFISLQRLDLDQRSAETKARQKEADLKLAERRVAVMEKKIADAQKTLGDSKLSDADKAQRLREIFKKG